MELIIFTGSFFTALSGALTPGPMLTAVISDSIEGGFKTGPLYVLGHGILELFILGIIILGVERFLIIPAIKPLFFITGGSFLIFISVVFFIKKDNVKFLSKDKNNLKLPYIIKGMLVSISNPYWLLWWLTTGLVAISAIAVYRIKGFVIFFLGHILADLFWYSLVSFSMYKTGRLLSSNAYRILYIICGIFLLGFGIFFIINGITIFTGVK